MDTKVKSYWLTVVVCMTCGRSKKVGTAEPVRYESFKMMPCSNCGRVKGFARYPSVFKDKSKTNNNHQKD